MFEFRKSILATIFATALVGFQANAMDEDNCSSRDSNQTHTQTKVHPSLTSSHKRPALTSERLDKIYKQLKSQNTLSEDEFTQRCRDPKNLNFSGLDFRGLNLSAYDLSYADFSGCKMRGVNFYGTHLCHAKFNGADLSKADCRKSDLTGADFGEAVLNGARFRGAKVLDVVVKRIRSAKGTLFADLMGLSSKQAYEQEIKEKITELTGSPVAITFHGSYSLSTTYQTLFENLCELQRQRHSHTLVDFRNLESIEEKSALSPKQQTDSDLYQITKEFVEILRSPYFNGLVEHIDPQYDNSVIVVKIKPPVVSLKDRIKKNSLKMPQLDLHAKIPLKIKYHWVEKFIISSQKRGCSSVEIVTGRGLHNPSGILGIQWTKFKDILTSEKYRPYVDDIHSTNKNGGWIVNLKNPNEKIINKKGTSLQSSKDTQYRKYLKDHKEENLKRATLRDEKYIPNLHEKKGKAKSVKEKSSVTSKKKRGEKSKSSNKKKAAKKKEAVKPSSASVPPKEAVKVQLKNAEPTKGAPKKSGNKAGAKKNGKK